jgi:L-amino acid N-acyltransferase YncA
MGLGALLLAKLIAMAAKLGYWYLRADILMSNRRSIKLFQKFNFRITDIHRVYWPANEGWVDEMTVERRIKVSV